MACQARIVVRPTRVSSLTMGHPRLRDLMRPPRVLHQLQERQGQVVLHQPLLREPLHG